MTRQDPYVTYVKPDDWPETVLKAEVLRIAKDRGWLVHHLTNSWKGRNAGQGHGYPDLTLARVRADGHDGRVIFVELKKQRTDLEPEQEKWKDVLGRVAGVEYYVWRPADLLNGEVARLLT